jgi:hypothetical protein
LRFYTPKQATPPKKPRKKQRVGIQGQPTAVHMPSGYSRDEEHHPTGYNAMVQIVGRAERRMGIDPYFTPHSSPTYQGLPPPPSPQSPLKKKRPRRSSIGVRGTQANNALILWSQANAARADLQKLKSRRRK